MVRIEGLTREDLALKEKASQLLDITRRFFHDHVNAEFSFQTRSINIGLNEMIVHPEIKQISIGYTGAEISATELARKYEEITGQEYIVKKTYTLEDQTVPERSQ